MKDVRLFYKNKHDLLVSMYCDRKSEYSRSFAERVMIDTGEICYSNSSHYKELDALSDKELEERLRALKAPWWNGIYRRISKHETLLLLIYVLFIRRPDRHTLRILYKMLTAKGQN